MSDQLPSPPHPAGRAIDLVAGARPNFMKLAPVIEALEKRGAGRLRVVHTGQHDHPAMSHVFFEELGLPRPDVNLEAGAAPHGAQTARILERYEALILEDPPRAAVVFGDVNGTVACALAAAKQGVPVIHVEAGLRSGDRSMPEEVNRIVTDAVSDLLLVTEPCGLENLAREGVEPGRVRLVGNPMIDTLRRHLSRARERGRAGSLGLDARAYGLLTLHRASNVDDADTLAGLVDTFLEIARSLPLVFPVHPRTRRSLEANELLGRLAAEDRILLLAPQPYVDSLSLLADARLVLTDSGGLQEEAAFLRVPCITMRETAERLATCEVGANRLVGIDAARISEAVSTVLEGQWPEIRALDLWDGESGRRAADAILAFLDARLP